MPVELAKLKQAEQALRDSNRRLQLLSAVASELLINDRPQEWLDSLFRRLSEFLDLELYFHYQLEPAGQAIRLCCCGGVPATSRWPFERLQLGERYCGWVAQTCEPAIIEDIQNTNLDDPRGELVRKAGVTAYACYPLLAHGRLIGTLSFGSRRRTRFHPDDLAMLHTICDQLAIAIDRSRARDLYREGEERYRLVGLATNDLIWDWDLIENKLLWSGAVEANLGYTSDEFGEQFDLWLDRVHPSDAARAHATISQAIANGAETWSEEYRFRRKDGSYAYIYDRGVIARDAEGKAYRMVGTMLDITPRKLVEEQLRALNETLEKRVAERTAVAEQRLAQLRELASELTQAEQRERRRIAQALHDDLQQLLVAAKLRIGSLRNRSDKPEVVKRAAGEVDELLTQSISASRSLTFELSPAVLYDRGLAAALHWLVRWESEKYALDVEVEAEHEAHPLAEDVRTLMFQAVRELLFNVVKHAGVARARVRMHCLDNGEVRVVVEDEGAGFEERQRIESERAAGAGFGLLSIRQRLELMGGRMEIDSVPGHGTRVTLSAPMRVCCSGTTLPPHADADDVTDTDTPRRPASTHGRRRGTIRVMLADDHKTLRDGLASLLREQPDIELVGEASDGVMAVELARRIRPQVIVMDITMPRMDGIEATRHITREMPQVKVIGLSMHEREDVAVAMREAGCVAYLPKGGTSELLMSTIRNCCGSQISRDTQEPMLFEV